MKHLRSRINFRNEESGMALDRRIESINKKVVRKIVPKIFEKY